jgi:hypothetical protein
MGKIRSLLGRAFLKAAFTIDPPKPFVEISDDYVKWLCFANAGMLDKRNLYLIDRAFSELRSGGPILEIGSFCGLSANVLTHYKRKHGLRNRLMTCDKWDFENDDRDNRQVGGSPVLFSDYKTFVRESYIRNTRMFSADDLPYTIEATSDEFFAAWREKKDAHDLIGRTIALGGPLSFCYIDGNHSYEGAKADFLNGGFLLFDDSTIESFGVRNLMPEVTASGRYELVAANPNHLFRKIK